MHRSPCRPHEPSHSQRPPAIARRSALGLLELVGDLLDVHKSEAGELRVTPRAIDLRALLAETATLFAAAAHEKGIELRAETAPDVPHGARFDPLRLRQVIGNVLSNAVKFTERGEVVINEINTMPGFTPYSMYPALWAASGTPYPELIDELLTLALERPLGLR